MGQDNVKTVAGRADTVRARHPICDAQRFVGNRSVADEAEFRSPVLLSADTRMRRPAPIMGASPCIRNLLVVGRLGTRQRLDQGRQ